MTYTSQQLMDELQKAVASQTEKAQEPKSELLLQDFAYEVSPDVADYFRRLQEYRERVKQVRVGEY